MNNSKIYLRIMILFFLFVLAGKNYAGNGSVSPDVLSKYKDYNTGLKGVGFIENKGQFCDTKGNPASNVLFKATEMGLDLYITKKGVTYVLLQQNETSRPTKKDDDTPPAPEKVSYQSLRIDMNLVGAKILASNIISEDPSFSDGINYFLAHCPKGIMGVKAYHKVTIKNVYPGIDWVLYDSPGKGLKSEFIVHPYSNPNQIRMHWKGVEKLSTDEKQTVLSIQTRMGILKEGEISSFRKDDNSNIPTTYRIIKNTVGFNIASYDKSRTLVIDPPMKLWWATTYGGNNADYIYSTAIDNANNLLCTGFTQSTDFPVLLAAGTYSQAFSGNKDVIILKFNNLGVRQWATVYGGSLEDCGTSITSDANNNIYVVGYTSSIGFPVHNLTGAYNQATITGTAQDGFILKFRPNGAIVWASLYGGSAWDQATSVAYDGSHGIFMSMNTYSSNLVINNPPGSYTHTYNAGGEMFLSKFDTATCAVNWSTYYGGNNTDYCQSICCNNLGDLLCVGYTKSTNFPTLQPAGAYIKLPDAAGFFDATILRFTNSCSLTWATCFGGTGLIQEMGQGIGSDAAGNTIIAGTTEDPSFPVQALPSEYSKTTCDSADLFVAKFNSANQKTWSTLYGGSKNDYFPSYFTLTYPCDHILTVEPAGYMYMNATARSPLIPKFPISPAYDTICFKTQDSLHGKTDMLLVGFTPQNKLEWSTYLGGYSNDMGFSIVHDANYNIFISGFTENLVAGSYIYTVNPGNNAYYVVGQDAYIAKFKYIDTIYFSLGLDSLICPWRTVHLTAQPGLPAWTQYKWTPSGSTATNITVSTPGYTVCNTFDSTTCVAHKGAITIIDTTISGINLGNDSIICPGKTATLKAPPGMIYYHWTPGNVGTANYTVSAPGVYKCEMRDSTRCYLGTITVKDTTYYSDLGQDSILCPGKVITLRGQPNQISYTWTETNPTGGPWTTDSILVTSTGAGTYTIHSHDSLHCYAGTIHVISAVTPLTIIGDTILCNGKSQVLTAPPGQIHYHWSTNDSTQTITVSTAGTYTVNTTDATNCYSGSINVITKSVTPLITLDTIVCQGIYYYIKADDGFFNYTWDKTTSPVYSQVLTVIVPGTYTITAEDADSCWHDGKVTVDFVNCDPLIALPNAFTPDGDGINDYFSLGAGTNITSLEIVIYNRWGEEVYTSNDLEFKWDGKYKGKDCQMGVYVWSMKYKAYNGMSTHISGRVTILR